VPPVTSLIVVSYETREATLACIGSLLEVARPGSEVIVVDNASSDGTSSAVAEAFPAVRVLAQAENLGFARAANIGARAAEGDYLGFVNSDCVARPGSVERLEEFLDTHSLSAAAVPRLLFPDGSVQHNAARLPTARLIAMQYLLGRVGDPYRVAELSEPARIEACSGAALFIRCDDFRAAGGFHEDYFMYVEDVELCRRLAELDRQIHYIPDAVMVHEGGVSSRPRAPALAEMLERHREDYARRTMGRVRAATAIAAMRIGRRLEPARNRVLRLARPARPVEPDVLSDEQVGQRVVLGGAQRAAAFVAANLLTVAAAVVLLRYLGVEEFGRYGTVLALVGVVQGISDAGLTATGTRELALCETDAERRDVLAHVLGLRVALTAIGVAMAIAFAAGAGYGGDLVLGTALAGFGVLLTSVQTAMLLPLGVQLRNGVIALVEVARQLILFLAFVVLAVGDAGLVPFFGAQILVGVVLLAITPVVLAAAELVAPRWTLARIRALAVIGLPIAVATVLGVLYLRLLVVLISLLSGDEVEVGYFVTSTRVFEVVGGLPFLISAVVLPVLTVVARDDRERLVHMTGRIVHVLALGGVLTALLLWTLAEPLVVLLGGEQYRPAAPVLQIQCFAAITVFVSMGWQSTLFGLGRVRSAALAIAAGLLAVLGTGLLLIPDHGATGAAIAAVVGDVVLCAAAYVALRLAGPGRWFSVGTSLRLATAAGAAVAVGLIPGLPDGVRAVAVTAVFAGVVLLLRAVPEELTEAARSAGPLRLRR
jgi:GT2 family glycosyltransferase/O-antigen/teichoic acid export membrane protein